MPYLKQESKEFWDSYLNAIKRGINDNDRIMGPGDLNYCITRLAQTYAGLWKNETYTTYNEIVGVLESVKLEFYRRAMAKYEDKKIQENGDVY